MLICSYCSACGCDPCDCDWGNYLKISKRRIKSCQKNNANAANAVHVNVKAAAK